MIDIIIIIIIIRLTYFYTRGGVLHHPLDELSRTFPQDIVYFKAKINVIPWKHIGHMILLVNADK